MSSPFALIPPASLECPRAVPDYTRTVLMPFVVDDEFHVFARERRLPPCALSFLMLAGSWSARESRSGFVPNSMLADFSDDFAQAERTLCSAGILKRVKAGVRIVEGHGVTVVNARDVTRDAEREQAEAERKRELERARKQRQREKAKAEREAGMSAGVPPVSRETSTDVPPEKTGKRKKRQVGASDVPRDIGGTSRGTESPSRARARQDDFDFDPREGVSQSKSDARGREDPALVAAVTDAICSKVGFVPGESQVCGIIAVYRERARKAGTRIRSELAYFPAAIANEPDLWDGLLLPKPPPMTELVAAEPPPQATAPGDPWASPWTPPDPSRHEFDPIPGGVVCRTCNRTENNPRHAKARLA